MPILVVASNTLHQGNTCRWGNSVRYIYCPLPFAVHYKRRELVECVFIPKWDEKWGMRDFENFQDPLVLNLPVHSSLCCLKQRILMAEKWTCKCWLLEHYRDDSYCVFDRKQMNRKTYLKKMKFKCISQNTHRSQCQS